jgi:hypothetical protein
MRGTASPPPNLVRRDDDTHQRQGVVSFGPVYGVAQSLRCRPPDRPGSSPEPHVRVTIFAAPRRTLIEVHGQCSGRPGSRLRRSIGSSRVTVAYEIMATSDRRGRP